MRYATLILALALSACTDKDKDPPEETDETDDGEDTFETAITYQDLTGQQGGITIVHYAADATEGEALVAAGIFGDDFLGLLDPAGCLLLSTPCLSALGDEDGETTDFDTSTLGATPLDAGLRVQAAGTTLFQDDSQGIPLYFGEPTSFEGSGLRLDGDFAPYDGTDAITFPTEMAVTAPTPTERIALAPDSTTLDFAWEAGTTGEVLIAWRDTTLHLADDGAYTLNLADLGLRAPYDSVAIQLLRTASTTIDAAGNEIVVTATSSQWYYLDYTNLEGSTELTAGANAAETCADAAALPALAAGSYYGDVAEADDDHDLGEGNDITGFETPGPDLVVPIALTAGQTLSIDLRHLALDTSVYLLDAGCDLDDALVGADELLDGAGETVEYEAEADATIYLVIDSYNSADDGRFGLTIEITDP